MYGKGDIRKTTLIKKFFPQKYKTFLPTAFFVFYNF
jgi:hypothetical protein